MLVQKRVHWAWTSPGVRKGVSSLCCAAFVQRRRGYEAVSLARVSSGPFLSPLTSRGRPQPAPEAGPCFPGLLKPPDPTHSSFCGGFPFSSGSGEGNIGPSSHETPQQRGASPSPPCLDRPSRPRPSRLQTANAPPPILSPCHFHFSDPSFPQRPPGTDAVIYDVPTASSNSTFSLIGRWCYPGRVGPAFRQDTGSSSMFTLNGPKFTLHAAPLPCCLATSRPFPFGNAVVWLHSLDGMRFWVGAVFLPERRQQ